MAKDPSIVKSIVVGGISVVALTTIIDISLGKQPFFARSSLSEMVNISLGLVMMHTKKNLPEETFLEH